jgi:hypothetical protein
MLTTPMSYLQPANSKQKLSKKREILDYGSESLVDDVDEFDVTNPCSDRGH